MFTQTRGALLEEEFSSTVESIMKCEDFKSNFARKLSNRFISRSPVSPPKPDSSLKLLVTNKNDENATENVPKRIEQCPQLSPTFVDQNREIIKPSNKAFLKNDIRNIEMTALNMEVETLRWQLAQTEANRQMHIALLRQIVTFLNRVKEHIEIQHSAPETKNDTISSKALARSFNFADLPRSRSVVQVNKNLECTLSTPKKISTRKISKSISNVNGFKDCSGVWNQSKLSLLSETENTHKITEEMTRLMTLANTVLSTKLPDLACTCNDKPKEADTMITPKNKELPNVSIDSFDAMNDDSAKAFTSNLINDHDDTCNGVVTNKFIDTKDETLKKIIVPPSTLTCGLGNDFENIKDHKKEQDYFTKSGSDSSIAEARKVSVDKKNDYNCSNFIEDESGFSSMNSFQEIGIPIISIIPPSPCKEMGYMGDIPDILEDSDKWKTDTMDLGKQTVKVFWV